MTLETVSYSREQLASHLDSVAREKDPNLPRFEIGHLPIFATLKGNDVITIGELVPFHNYIMGNFE